MSIIYHDDWELSERGKKDAARHREKIDEEIKKNVRDAISEESIITKKRGKKVRIPVKGLKDYRFKYGKKGGGGKGVGQGDAQPGDIIGRKQKEGKGDGKPGNTPGEDVMEVEVDIDYLIKIMFEDLGLPWLEEKNKATTIIPKGWKFETISKKGIPPRIHKKRSFKEAIKRNLVLIAEIEKQTGCDKETAQKALHQAIGDLNKAIDLVKSNKVTGIQSNIIITDDDLRYKQIDNDIEIVSNAVVIAMMDVSASMDTIEKKYYTKSILFWTVEFLKKVYEHVEIRFISHSTEAQLVDEDTFFKKGMSGGTKCASAFKKANYLIDTEYPISDWNVYTFYAGDGEAWDIEETILSIKDMLNKNINMLSYCEIKPTERGPLSMSGTLLGELKKEFNFKEKNISGTTLYKDEKNHFLISVVKSKEHIFETLKWFLFKEDKK